MQVILQEKLKKKMKTWKYSWNFWKQICKLQKQLFDTLNTWFLVYSQHSQF